MDIKDVDDKLESIVNLTQDLCKMHGVEKVEVCFYTKSKFAGWAKAYPHYKISYHLHYLLQNYETFIRTTVFHEVAHIVEHKLYGKMSHGKRWRTIMQRFGFSTADIKRCHSYKDFREQSYE